ncbi:MAG: TIM-barrel domain-containing protein, partial [Deltaproteobacteria bacterium]
MDDSLARVSLTAGPLRLRVNHADGTPWFASPSATPFLEIGAYPGGPSPSRFHDPRLASPGGVEWRAPSRVSDDTVSGGSVITLLDDRVGPVTVSIAAVIGAPGTFHMHVEARGRDAAMLRVHLAADEAGAYHGLGERFGRVDARGTIVPMQLHVDGRSESSTNEAHVPVPFVASTRSYGLFVASREAGAFDVAATEATRVSATFEGAVADVYLFAARTPGDVVAAYTRTAGLPRLPPRWAFGPMQWRNVWDSADAMLADARRLRAEDIPTTTMWIDNPWEASYNDHVFDTRRFPDPVALLGELRALGYRSIVWSTPYVDAVEDGASPANAAERLFVTARDRNWLVRYPAGLPYISISNPASAAGIQARGGMMDFTSPEASAFWTERLAPLMELGLRGFKLDYGEDIVSEIGGTRTRFAFADGTSERAQHGLYPQGYHSAYRAALDQRAGGDGFLIVRASS